jgi:ribonuclease J
MRNFFKKKPEIKDSTNKSPERPQTDQTKRPDAKPQERSSNSNNRTRFKKPHPNKGRAPSNRPSNKPNEKPNDNKPAAKGKLKAYILGGLNEVGKNCLAIEHENDIIVVDVGMAFPDDEMLGVDFVIPDTSFLEKNKHRIRGFVITHAHLDHIGALQHVLPKCGFPPMVMTKLTSGLVTKRLEEYGVMKQSKIHVVDPLKDTFKLGSFELEFFPVNHSIPDCMGVYGKTAAGTFVHTGDFKFDFTPADGKPADMGRMAEIGKSGVDVLFCESTNAPKAGFCISEKIIAKNLHDLIANADGRIILASFSSLVSRIEQIVQYATKYNRKVFISGRSMQNTLDIAARFGHFKAPKGSIRRLGPAADSLPDSQVLILTTGSQGEPRSALTRIGNNTHPQISIKKGDTVVFSSSPIPGNERGVYSSINNLIKLGANVVTNNMMDIHVSGHGHEGDLKMMHSLMKPKFIVPIHGELFMRQAHKKIAMEMGHATENIPLLENGSIIEYERGHLRRSKSKIPSELILIDGLGSGDVGTKVMDERKIMSNGGTIMVILKVMEKSGRLVGDPEIISRGFIYMRESKDILRDAQIHAKKSYEKFLKDNPDPKRHDVKRAVERGLQTLIYKRIQREPMIMPVIVPV